MISGETCVWNVALNRFPSGEGAHSWILERRNGLARGIYKRLKEARHYTGP